MCPSRRPLLDGLTFLPQMISQELLSLLPFKPFKIPLEACKIGDSGLRHSLSPLFPLLHRLRELPPRRFKSLLGQRRLRVRSAVRATDEEKMSGDPFAEEVREVAAPTSSPARASTSRGQTNEVKPTANDGFARSPLSVGTGPRKRR